MKIPRTPSPLGSLLKENIDQLDRIIRLSIGPEISGVYEHWDHLRHLSPPDGLTVEQWWLAIKLARSRNYRELPLRDKENRLIKFVATDSMQRALHFLDREAAGSIRGLSANDGKSAQERYLMRSLVEEAMTSAQLEGASTTSPVAKEMLNSGRSPRDRGERMIYNNFATMRELRRWSAQDLTPAAVFEIHRMITDGTLEHADQAGRLRRSDEPIEVVSHDNEHRVLHRPPPAEELPARLEALCAFANDATGDAFLHPAVRAIALHYQIGYDHPFVDGNGRTARALFYWSMQRAGYWLTQYLSISARIKAAPAQYQLAYLYTETDESDLSYFVAHQLHVIEQAVEGLKGYLARKLDDHRQAEALLHPASKLGRSLNHRQRALLLHALRHPGTVYKIAQHQSAQQVTYATARADLLGLVKTKLFRQLRQGSAFAFIPAANLERLIAAQS